MPPRASSALGRRAGHERSEVEFEDHAIFEEVEDRPASSAASMPGWRRFKCHAVVPHLMARKPRRQRRKFNLRQVRINASSPVGALAALDVVTNAVTAASLNRFRLVTVKASYSLVDLGAAIDDGQEFGLAHSDYSATEIEECLEAASAIDVGDKVAQEQANRLVRSIGVFASPAVADASLQFNQGRQVRTKLNWMIGIGQTLTLWIRNGSGTVYTTGASVIIAGSLWVKD